jgi:hypothetical protein
MKTVLCPSEEVLLARAMGETMAVEVAEHLEQCPDCQARLKELQADLTLLRQTAVPALPETIPSETPIHPPVTGRPATIGKYFVVGTLDEGGQAVVYRALHPTLGKDVAIKWSRQAAGSEGKDLLAHEGKLLADLDHPNLVRVYDLDFHEGRPYLVLEYVRGGNLEQAVQRRRLTPRDAADLLAPVARAVAVAHRRGITHQDIKPRNILIDEQGRPRLTDFGIARLQHAWSDPPNQPVGGTLSYMAPEQARGEADRVGPPSDIFALGGVLYFLLTGQPPFPGSNPILVQQQAAKGEVNLTPLASARVPGRLAAICRKALAPNPNDRYASADHLADDLDRFLRRPRQWLIGGAVGAVVFTLLAGFFLLQPEEAAIRPTEPQRLVYQVRRGQELLPDLKSALPMSNGDRFEIRCDLPRGAAAALFGFDSAGKLEAYAPVRILRSGQFDQLRFPEEGLVRLRGEPGTELLLVCAGRSRPPTLPELEPFFAEQGPWPPLPAQVLVRMDPETVQVEGLRGLDVAPGDALSAVEARMEKLRQYLGQHYEFFVGVAYPHQK